MASYSVGLPPGSPPPTRAATSMFLINRANILPRRASTTAFLCLVVAHLEWPLMKVPAVLSHPSLVSWPDESTWTAGGRRRTAPLASHDSRLSQELRLRVH